MHISLGSFIVTIILTQRLRKFCKTNEIPRLQKLFMITFFFSIFLFVAEVSFKAGNITKWIWDLLLAALLIFAFQQKELRVMRMSIYAFLPFLIISFLTNITEAISSRFYNEWDNYFDYAEGFAYIWMGVILFTHNKQMKIAEKDWAKRKQEEEINKAIAIRKDELEKLVKERTAEIMQQKEELEHTLIELRSTQTQLIQSEKMASLGELTAGIAHEIQNPLNFVNNFSEVNKELLVEMKEEIDKGNMDEVKTIAADIISNEEKINHHGKRADAIVKGMLQHSRSSSGVKEPTDINALCDEYLRLSYHGLRAKDKLFNATMKTDFDTSIGKVKVIPQDMGRVILNLLTNAFYAASLPSPKKIGTDAGGFSNSDSTKTPTVWVRTKKEGDKVLISVKDNGNGIPQKILDKIFQPFFTTKPTGQGTGLGLSMSYDIVTKGHGGELKVETEEGEGTTFIIQIPLS